MEYEKMALKIVPYNATDAERWDEFCGNRTNATFLHTRRYMSYHQENYVDLSLLIYSRDKLIGLFPIAISILENAVPMSHPGISYGGIIHSGKLLGGAMGEAFDLSFRHLRNLGYQKFVYRPIPFIYNGIPAQDDIYALFVRGARLTRCDLSSSINLSERRKIESKRVNLQISKKSKYSLATSFDKIDEFWILLEKNLIQKYGASPTHSLNEISNLKKLFPKNIELLTISNTVECVAGLILYLTENVCHIQYMGANSEGREESALDTLIEKAISIAIEKGCSFLDFGHSNENYGQNLNLGLYSFKSKFGGGGVGLFEFSLDI
jgi:hypothetical protein